MSWARSLLSMCCSSTLSFKVIPECTHQYVLFPAVKNFSSQISLTLTHSSPQFQGHKNPIVRIIWATILLLGIIFILLFSSAGVACTDATILCWHQISPSAFHFKLKTNGSPRILQPFSGKLRPLRHPGESTTTVFSDSPEWRRTLLNYSGCTM